MSKIRYGYFKSRINRFVVEHSLDSPDGPIVRSYIPNPGRLWELFYTNSELVLVKNNSSAKYEYSVEAVYKKDQLVYLHTLKNNDMAEYWLRKGSIPEFKNYNVVKREVMSPHGKSRFDFLLEKQGEPLYLEVKSCSLFQGRMAMFPDAPTERGTRHLKELLELKDMGYNCAVLIIVQSSNTPFFLPEYHTDPSFAEQFYFCKDKLKIAVMGAEIKEDLRFTENPVEMEIPWDVLKRENKDRGLLIQSYHIADEILSNGKVLFKAGYYTYISFVKESLLLQEARARRKKKRPKSIQENLRLYASKTRVFSIRGFNLDLKEFCKDITWEQVDGSKDFFGYFTDQDPITQEHFITHLLYYRMEKILK